MDRLKLLEQLDRLITEAAAAGPRTPAPATRPARMQTVEKAAARDERAGGRHHGHPTLAEGQTGARGRGVAGSGTGSASVKAEDLIRAVAEAELPAITKRHGLPPVRQDAPAPASGLAAWSEASS